MPLYAALDHVYTRIYILGMGDAEKAKIFQNGGSQAVRLPKSCRFPDNQREVLIKKVGRRVVLEPADEWRTDFLECLGAWPGEIERPPSHPISDARDPFE